MRFRYGQREYVIHGKHVLTTSHAGGIVRFQAQVLLTGGDIGAQMNELATSFQDFELPGRFQCVNGSEWITRAEVSKTGSPPDTGVSALVTFALHAMRASAVVRIGGVNYYIREGTHTLNAEREAREIVFTGTVVFESAASYAAGIAALSTSYQDLEITSPDGSRTLVDATGPAWINIVSVSKEGADADESYACRMVVQCRRAGHQFTYGVTTYRIEGDAQLSVSDATGAIQYTAMIAGLTSQDVPAALAALATSEEQFVLQTLEPEPSTLFAIDPASRVGGMGTRGAVTIARTYADGRADIQFTLVAEREPAQAGRNGRRDATVGISVDASGIRTITLRGTWTGTPSGSAMATFDANVAPWANSVVSSIVSGVFQRRESPLIEFDDRNHLLRFSIVYQEVEFPFASPLETTNGLYRSMVLSISTPADWGAAPIAGVPSVPPTRAHVETVTDYRAPAAGAALYIYWRDVVLPWVKDAVSAATGIPPASWTMDTPPTVTLDTIERRRVSGSVTMVEWFGVRNVSEEVMFSGDEGVAYSRIYDGLDHSYDLRRIGASLEVTHTVTIQQTGIEPSFPIAAPSSNLAASNQPGSWVLLEATPPSRRPIVVKDPDGVRRLMHTWQYRRRYLFVGLSSAGAPLSPRPLG